MKRKTQQAISFLLWGCVVGFGLVIVALMIIFSEDIFSDYSRQNMFNKVEERNAGVKAQTGDTLIDLARAQTGSLLTIMKKQQVVALRPEVYKEYFQIDGNPGLTKQLQTELTGDIGSGFVLGDYVLTNRHVVAESGDYVVIDNLGREYEVVDKYVDVNHDVAILRVQDLGLKSLELAPMEEVRVGARVISLGTSLGNERYRGEVGEITGLKRSITATSTFGEQVENLTDLMQISVVINPGSSGGPVLNEKGLVVGMNVATAPGEQGRSYALDVGALRGVIDNFEANGGFERPYLGLMYRPISANSEEMASGIAGAQITAVLDGSSAQEANLKVGDVIVAIDGVEIEDGKLMEALAGRKVGERVRVMVVRNGVELEAELKLDILPIDK